MEMVTTTETLLTQLPSTLCTLRVATKEDEQNSIHEEMERVFGKFHG
jgi:hypothetical protein